MRVGSLEMLLATFTPKELDQLSEFLSITTFGAKPKHKKLFETLIKTSVDVSTSYVNRRQQDRFDDLASKRVELRLLKSELKVLVEKYIDFKKIEKDKISRDLRLLNFYKQKDLNKLFTQKVKRLEKRFGTSLTEGARKQKIEFEIEKLAFQLSQSRSNELNVQTILDEIDIAYYVEKLKQVCVALSHQAIYNKDYNYGLLDEVLEYIKHNSLYNVPLIGVYYHCYHMLVSENEESHFRNFIKIIQGEKKSFTKSDLTSLYRFAINYCIRRLNVGNKGFLGQGLELYKVAIDEGYFIEDGYLSRFTYRNVAMMAIRLDQYNWAEEFSERFAHVLRKKYKESAYLFNMALIQYHQKSFDEALQSLIKIRIKDPLINLSIKTLQLKIYYELDNVELLLSHLDAMQAYIIRNKVLGYHRNNYLNVVKYGKRLVKLKYASEEKISSTITAIKKEQYLTEKKWFTEQLVSKS